MTGTPARLCTALGLVSAGGVLARTRDLGRALPVLLEVLTAAGVVRLAHDPTWGRSRPQQPSSRCGPSW